MFKSAQPDLITIGETMILVAPLLAEPLETGVDFRLTAGGAESNVAMHMAQLGCSAEWVSLLGNDALGRRISRQLEDRNVGMQWVAHHPTAPTGVYFKDPGSGVQYFRAGSAASAMGPETITEIPLEQAGVVHISGITQALSTSCQKLIGEVVRRVGSAPAVLSFDVNHRPALWGERDAAKELAAVARQSDIVFVGLDEADALWGTSTPEQVREYLPEPKLLVVKDSDIGATEFDGATKTFVPAVPTLVVEAVGAGDAFAAGYLSAFLGGLDTERRLLAGHRQAVLVLQSTSDVP
ncbi:sugar kinase [Arthrobacter sp. zg-ZUI100]|uniref:sugar kinase n=1 Tax=Arthrobacter jiangjiafuii TaxID=2817475 RepID=UPI001AEE714A|nr:sugar kinase [Arthrobacter jiangjiafuii]MBP3037171.1 sugar kinase [Arthrobacter jiangjiafuii]